MKLNKLKKIIDEAIKVDPDAEVIVRGKRAYVAAEKAWLEVHDFLIIPKDGD